MAQNSDNRFLPLKKGESLNFDSIDSLNLFFNFPVGQIQTDIGQSWTWMVRRRTVLFPTRSDQSQKKTLCD